MNGGTEEKTAFEKMEGRIQRQFKAAVDFYRMEYSDNLILLFNEFGYLLICRSVCGKQGYDLKDSDFSDKTGEDINAYIDSLEQCFKMEAPRNPRFSFLNDFNRTIRKSSVIRPILEIVNELYELSRTIAKKQFYHIVRQIFTICSNVESYRTRYTLPDDITRDLVRLLNAERKMQDKNETISVLDPQMGSGSMLIAAKDCYHKAVLTGYEEDRNLRISAQILSFAADAELKAGAGDLLTQGIKEKYDIVITNPPFNSELLPDFYYDFVPKEMQHIRGRYNMSVVCSLAALKEDGRCALIVPNSFLFSSKRESVEVRRWMLETFCVEGIISLPPNIFYQASSVRSSIVIAGNPVMAGGWQGCTPYLSFFELGQEGIGGLLDAWEQRERRYLEWMDLCQESLWTNYNNIKTPEAWEYGGSWFADVEIVQQENWNLLPEHYKPAERMELEFEAPEMLLSGLIQEQKELLRDMEGLFEEVTRL